MLIELKGVSHIYEQQHKALDDISLTISEKEFIGLVGHTGSGKSTLVQVFNGLIKPSSGEVLVDGNSLVTGKVNLKDIRKRIGLVFQYPEHQLFEEKVYDDIAFGPSNLGYDDEKIEVMVQESMHMVGLDYEKFKDRSPFNLSGGQQRKAAIAGVLAMKPEVLILDEPTAGLDPLGREKLMSLLETLFYEYGITIVLISHRMEEVARLSNRVIVMNNGRIELDGNPKKVFSQAEKLREIALDLPEITEILYRLKLKGLNIDTGIFSVQDAAEEIAAKLRGFSPC